MNHANGRVVTADGGQVTVEFARTEACAKCRACSLHETTMRVDLPNDIGAHVGEEVAVLMASGQLTKASALGYLVPLAGLLAGLGVGAVVGGDIGGAIGGIAGLALCALVQLRVVEPALRKRDAFPMRIAHIDDAPPAEADDADRKG